MSQAASSNIVFDDIFRINAIDREGKKFDRGASLGLSNNTAHSPYS